MDYTYQRLRILNSVLLENRPGIQTSSDGLHLYTDRLPADAVQMTSESLLRNKVPYSSNPWDKVLPVFIRTASGRIRIAYVNCSEKSITKVSEKIEEGRVYYIPSLIVEVNRKKK